MSAPPKIQSVNWHLISACNFACRFCFARNLGETPVGYEEGKEIIRTVSDMGMDKINFAGGEPLLHPQILDYCKVAKDYGMTVSITTNGSLLNGKMIHEMRGNVDWIALSVDSCLDEVETKLGRGTGNHVSHCMEVAEKIHEAGIHLKVNTTVTAFTFRENMRPLIKTLNPERWKVLQMLHIKGENDDAVADLSITHDQFRYFIKKHQYFLLENGKSPVFESCDDIESSYFMLTPRGNVKIDTGRVITTFPLDEVVRKGVEHFVDPIKYLGRGGLYEWD